MKLTLKEPIQFGSETITELEFVKPKAKHLRSLPIEPGISDLLDLAGTISGQPKKVIDELSAEDTFEVLEVLNRFLPSGQKTGDKQ